MQEFFRVTISKIVIAKIFGIPLIIADVFFRIFSHFSNNILINVVVLIFGSYILACIVDYVIMKRTGRIQSYFPKSN